VGEMFMSTLINKIKKVYTDIPLWVTNIAAPIFYLIPQKIRYGKIFDSQINLLKNQEYLDKNKVDFQVNKSFIELINHAYENVPYYRKVFDENGIKLEDIRTVNDIHKLPFLTKEDLVNYREELIASNVDKTDLLYITTSGSTGNPVGFYVDPESTMKEWAYTNYIWNRVGYKPDSSRLLLRGKTFWSQKRKGKSWQYDALRRELSCNIFDLNESNLESYCRAIEKYKPEYIHGYMSATYVLCKYIEKRSVKMKHKFKAVLAVSENIIESQKEYVEKILGCRVFSFYGHSERLVIAGECEYSSDYHIEPFYGYAEIVDENGNQIRDNRVGEIVATGFCNKGMPMIRYKTGDMANWSNVNECKCGRSHLRLAGVHGRWKQDVLVNKDGALVALTALNMHSDVFDNIIRYQFYQQAPGEVTLKIVPGRFFAENNVMSILQQLEEKTQKKINYKIEMVNEIKTKKNGKYAMVDQNLEIDIFR